MFKLIGRLLRHREKLLKFGLVGGMWTITNLSLFFMLADKLKLPDVPASIFCFLVSASQNYLINHIWTFSEQHEEAVSLKLWTRYLMSSVAGYGVNLGAYMVLVHAWAWPYKVIPQAFGIICGMALNYASANFLIFRNRGAVEG